jgi:(+)-trans-carveol dehydrogenase
MGQFDGRVALITGGARGQGRSHAVRLAEEGADIIVVDSLESHDWMGYPLATEEDLEETVRLVEKLDRRIVARKADVRDFQGLSAAIDEGVAELGGLDFVCANAGAMPIGDMTWDIPVEQWRAVIDINLTGVFHTAKAVVPHMLERETPGSIVLIASGAALNAGTHFADYCAAKAAVVSLTKTLAYELAPHWIRVNNICPTSVDTDMIQNQTLYNIFRPDLEKPGRDDVKAEFQSKNLLPLPWVDPVDISNAVVWLCSEQARYVTGVTLPIDAGNALKKF